MHVSLIALAEPLPVAQQPVPQQLHVDPARKVQKAVTPHAPLDAPSEAAISLSPAPPAPAASAGPATVAASASPAPAVPVVLPRFDAAYLQNPAPLYPALSRRLGEQGRVLLRVVVKPDGTPEAIALRASSGSQRLDEAALEAVRKWRFVPARQGDTPVAAAVIVPIVFSLES